MKIIFLRHADTRATEQGLVQGSSNHWDLNAATTKGLYKVQDSARKIAEMIAGTPKENVFVYSATQGRCRSTTGVLETVLKPKKLIDSGSIVYDERLNGRGYGDLEGKKESKVKSPSYLLVHPVQMMSYIASQIGYENMAKIEPENKYAERIGDALADIFMLHNNDKDVVIISSTSDMFNAMQKNKELHMLCYFGYETPPFVEGKKAKREKIEPGEVKTFELDAPRYSETDGRWIPVWETKAIRDYMMREGMITGKENYF